MKVRHAIINVLYVITFCMNGLLAIIGMLGEILPVKTVDRIAAAVGISDFIRWYWTAVAIVLGLTVIVCVIGKKFR